MRVLIALCVLLVTYQAFGLDVQRHQGTLQHEVDADVEARGDLTLEVPATNFDNHRTNRYLTKDTPFVVFRRGAPVDLNVCLTNSGDANQFDLAKVKVELVDAQDKSVLALTTVPKAKGFITACPAKSAIQIELPGDMAWGKYSFQFRLTDKANAAVVSQINKDVYVIFNAWSDKDKDVYLADSAQLDEYVQNNIAYVWHAEGQNDHYTFDLGQHSILPIVYEWATLIPDKKIKCSVPRTTTITKAQRKSAYQTLQFFAPLFQTSDQYGSSATFEQQRTDSGCHGFLLIGRWGLSAPEQPADYSTNPTAKAKFDKELAEFETLQNNWYWQVNEKEKAVAILPWRHRNIGDIFARWKSQNGMPVRFAQCFIYASVTTATGRTLGIPIRPVSTIDRSCHPSHNDPWAVANKNAKDKVTNWNFHVWTDAYVANPINGNTPQWNAFDGNTVNGPIPLKFIKENKDPATLKDAKDKRDLKEFIGETKELYWRSATPFATAGVNVNDKEVRRAKHNDGTLSLATCAKFMYSKKVGCSETGIGATKSGCADANEMLNYKPNKWGTFFSGVNDPYFLEEESETETETEDETEVKPNLPVKQQPSAKPQKTTGQPKPIGPAAKPFKVKFQPTVPFAGDVITASVVKHNPKAQLQIKGDVTVEVFINDYTNRVKLLVERKKIPAATLGNDITKATISVNPANYIKFMRIREVRYIVVRFVVPINKREYVIRGVTEARLPTVSIGILDQQGKNPMAAVAQTAMNTFAKVAQVVMDIKKKYPTFKFDNKGQPEFNADKTFDVEVSFKNPLKIALTKGTLVVQDGTRKHKVEIPSVKAGAVYKYVVKGVVAGQKGAGGARDRILNARFDFAELHDFAGQTSWTVPDQTARKNVSWFAKLLPWGKK